jgi:hypothetical protein
VHRQPDQPELADDPYDIHRVLAPPRTRAGSSAHVRLVPDPGATRPMITPQPVARTEMLRYRSASSTIRCQCCSAS